MKRIHVLLIHALISATAAGGILVHSHQALADGAQLASPKLKLKTGEELTITQQNGSFKVLVGKTAPKDGKLTLSNGSEIVIRHGALSKRSIDKLGLTQQVTLKMPLDNHPDAVALITKAGVRFQSAKGSILSDGKYKFTGGKSFTIKNGVMAPEQALLLTVGKSQFEATKDQVLVVASLPESVRDTLNAPADKEKIDSFPEDLLDEVHAWCDKASHHCPSCSMSAACTPGVYCCNSW